jgi:outer membrane protein
MYNVSPGDVTLSVPPHLRSFEKTMFSSLAVRAGLLTLALFSFAGTLPAQTKVAVVNLQRAVLESADIKKASAELEAKFKPRQVAAQKIEQELQTIQQQLQNGQGKLSPQAEGDLQAQGTRRQRELQRMSDDLQADVDRDRNEILGKAAQKMQAVVKILAESKGFDIVIDTQTAIYFKAATEITTEAIAAYDKAYPVK